MKNYPDEERAKSEVEQQIVEGKDPRLPKKVDPLRRPPSPGSDETQKSPTEPAPPPPQ